MRQKTMSRRSFLASTAFTAAGTAFGLSGKRAHAGDAAKNIICILCDDMGAEELGCYGNTHHDTPNLDALAASGVRFETFYAAPVCSPTRVCLMTGRYGFRTGWCNMRGRAAGGPVRHDVDLARDETNFAQLLASAGYATGFAGKWQLTGDNLETMLSDAGFQESLIWIYTNYLAQGESYKGGYHPPGGAKSSRYWHPGLARNGAHFATTPDEYGPDMFCEFCLDFIRGHAREPFLLYYPMTLIHRPWVATPDTPELRGENTRAHLKANVEYTDKIVGRIVDELDKLGIRENTIIMFTGDNGTQVAGKCTPTEWGARVPFIVSCPGTVPSGVVSRELSDISDILPTMLDFAGVEQPRDIMIDGHNIAPYLRGETDATRRGMVFSFLGQYRILRNKHYLLEQNSADDFGQLFYCGESRDGRGYVDVTDSNDPDHIAARKHFEMYQMGYLVPPTTVAERLEFEAQTIPKLEGLNKYLAQLDKRIPLRRVPSRRQQTRKRRQERTQAAEDE
ncbi:MAG TPA: hypothetical protein ENN29_11105 [Candidatus Hydrogenedentes bacterium]|nr:hypothetical protein [Candidatus Hydrogenedentota bacterium]